MKLGIIGGSGLYALPQLAAAHRVSQETPWGWPSDALVEGRLEGLPVVFLPRHGPHHSIAPGEINYRANIASLKARGCTAIRPTRCPVTLGPRGCTCRRGWAPAPTPGSGSPAAPKRTCSP